MSGFKNKWILLPLAILFFFSSLSSSEAEIYYVDTDGSDSDQGTEQLPWRTINHAVSQVSQGDTVLIQPGRYVLSRMIEITTSGAENNRITIAGNGDGSIIDASSLTSRSAINIYYANYITIENLEIQRDAGGDSSEGIRAVGTNNVIIRNNISHGSAHAGIFCSRSSNILIEDNECYDNRIGIYVADSTSYPTVRSNELFNNLYIGLHMNGDNGPTGTISNALVEKNRIYNNGQTGINCDGVINSEFRNNLLYNNAYRGIVFFQQDGTLPSNDNEVYHNTIVMPATGYYIIGINNGSTHNVIFNNILLSENNVSAIDSNTGSFNGLVSDYNMMGLASLSTQQDRGFDTNSFVETVGNVFVDSSENNYKLRTGCLAINNASALYSTNEDIIGITRPVGNFPDIGAYEWVSATTGITVSPTSGLETTETGDTSTFSVVLNTEPLANVVINLNSSDTTEGVVSPSTLTYTIDNWSTSQIVSVTGVDDDTVDGDQAYVIVTSACVSNDPAYNTLNPADVSLVNVDDDRAGAAGVTVSPTSGLETTETGDTSTFSVVLNTEPLANVVINLNSSDTTEGVVSPSTLTFNRGSWTTSQIVTVTGVDDDAIDGDQAYVITTSACVSNDPAYNNLNPVDVFLINVDNDNEEDINRSDTDVDNGSSGGCFIVVVVDPDN